MDLFDYITAEWQPLLSASLKLRALADAELVQAANAVTKACERLYTSLTIAPDSRWSHVRRVTLGADVRRSVKAWEVEPQSVGMARLALIELLRKRAKLEPIHN
jgi:hypothetical protein